jgi:large subunit ribosomal protein L30
MAAKKDDPKKDAVASLEELEKAVARPKKAKPAEPAVPAAAKASPARETKAPTAHAKPTGSLRIRLVKSGICTPKDQKATLFGLGLRRIRQEVVRGDTKALRGMIHKVSHLVEVTPAK